MKKRLFSFIKMNAFLIFSVVFLNSLLIAGYAQQKYTSKSQLGTAYSGSIQPLGVLASQDGVCRALAPTNWVISGVAPQGNALDLIKPDKSMYAGYLNVGVTGSKAYYDKDFSSARAFLQTTVSEKGRLKVMWGEPLKDNLGLTILPFELKDPNDPHLSRGIVFYMITTVPGDINGYIIEMFTAQTYKEIWESQGAEAIAVALSIRCTGGLQKFGGISTYKRIDADRIESFYIGELGMLYANDPIKGDNYWVNLKTDRNNDGAQGPGYYLKRGNELQRLSPGRKDQ